MNISKAFKALGNQHLEEQNLLNNGIATIKDFFDDRKVRKMSDIKSQKAELLSKKLKSKLSLKSAQKQMKI